MTSSLIIKRLFTVFSVFALAALLASCGAARYSGLNGSVMEVAGIVNVAVAPGAGLEAKLGGVGYGALDTDANLKAHSRINYAVYGQEEDGRVLAHAHVMAVELSNKEVWEFAMETFTRRNEVYLRVVEREHLGWTEHLLYEPAEGDWFSELWRENGRAVPEMWIGKRWSRTFFGGNRVVAEYREPMPECVEVTDNSGQAYVVHAIFKTRGDECQRALDDFDARADAAFAFGKLDRSLPLAPAAPAALTVLPQASFKMLRLVGKAQVRSWGGADDWLD